MRLFNLEAHISVIADVENIFTRLYPDIEITSWNLSNHSFVFGREAHQVEVINQETWKSIDQKKIDKFHQRYDGFLQTFDGFICGFPPVFALLFEKYNKPIFMINATRYEMPFCWQPNKEMQQFFEKRLLIMQQKGQLIAVSNNKGDVGYLEKSTGVKSEHIPSLCLYTEQKYQPSKNEFILSHRLKNRIAPIPNTIHHKQLGRYTWEDLYSYRGIIHIPYEISTMSIFEQYSANIPLFMPSKAFLKSLLSRKKITFNGPYTRKGFPKKLESMLGNNWHEYWVDNADYYDQDNMPFITYYDSLYDIPKLIESTNTTLISSRMSSWNKRRQAKALQQWQSLIAPHYEPPSFKSIIGVGQINMMSEFGKKIHSIACNKHFNSYLEIGTWNGEGSTVCLMNGLMSRNDDSQLFSLELMPEMHAKAEMFWSWISKSKYAHQLTLLNGKIINEGLMTRQEVESHPAFEKVKKHYELYYKSDLETFEAANNVANKLPKQIDVALLDGGEFCSTAEFNFILENLSPKVFILDDSSIIKCAEARDVLLKSDEWVCIYDKPDIRHEAAIFIKRDLEHVILPLPAQ